MRKDGGRPSRRFPQPRATIMANKSICCQFLNQSDLFIGTGIFWVVIPDRRRLVRVRNIAARMRFVPLYRFQSVSSQRNE
jgi:hypothetical protein